MSFIQILIVSLSVVAYSVLSFFLYNLVLVKNIYFLIGWVAVSSIFIIGVFLWTRRLFGRQSLPGASAIDSTDPASILTQIQNIQSTAPTASSLDQVVQQLNSLKVSLSALTDQTIASVLQVVNASIDSINAGTDINADMLNQALGMLNGHVSASTLAIANNLSDDLSANANPNTILADLKSLKDALTADFALSSQSILPTATQSVQNAINQIQALDPNTAQALKSALLPLPNANVSADTSSVAEQLLTDLNATSPNILAIIADLTSLQTALQSEQTALQNGGDTDGGDGSGNGTDTAAALAIINNALAAVQLALTTVGQFDGGLLASLNRIIPILMNQPMAEIALAATKLSADLSLVTDMPGGGGNSGGGSGGNNGGGDGSGGTGGSTPGAITANNFAAVLQDLQSLQSLLQKESLPMASKIDNLLSSLTQGVSLSPNDEQLITNLLNSVTSINSANPDIQNAIDAINSSLGSNATNVQTLTTNLGNLQTAASAFQTQSSQQFTNVSNQIGSTISAIQGVQTLNSGTQSTITSLLTNVGNLTTTNNAIQTLASTIQQQMGTSSSTGSLITNLTSLQNAVNQLSTTQTSQYNTLTSSIASVTSAISGLNTLASNNQTSVNNILSTAQALNSANTTISTNVSAVQGTLNTVRTNLSTALTNIGNLQTAVNNATTSSASSFTSLTNSLNSVSNTLSSGVSLNSATSGQINSALTNIQNAVVKTYTKGTYIQAIAQLKQSFADLGFAATLGIEQLQAIDAIAAPQTGLTLVFDEVTPNKSIGISRGRVYKDTDGTYYHIDGYGVVGGMGTAAAPVAEQYKVFDSGATAYLYVTSDTMIYDSTDQQAYTSINLTNGTPGTNSFLVLNGQAINYGTIKPGVIMPSNATAANVTYYYIYNGSVYTSTDFVKFTNAAGNVVYYMDSGVVVPSSAVTTDANNVLWTKLGLMSVQVYNPSVFVLSYGGTSYSIYHSPAAPLISNAVWSNGSNYLYQYQNDWYVSTNAITFNKIILDASQNPTGVDTSAAGTIYTFCNFVSTTAPATMTNASKTYWQFGNFLYVNPTDPSDNFVYYNTTVYAKQPASNSHSWNNGYLYPNYSPTYISSGSLQGSFNTIVVDPTSSTFSIFNGSQKFALKPDGTQVSDVGRAQFASRYSSNFGFFFTDVTSTNKLTIGPYQLFLNGTNLQITRSDNASFVQNFSFTAPENYVLFIRRSSATTLQYVIDISSIDLDIGWGPSFQKIQYISFETNYYLWNGGRDLRVNTFSHDYSGIALPMLYCTCSGYIDPSVLEKFTLYKVNCVVPGQSTTQATNYTTLGLPGFNGRSYCRLMDPINKVAFTLTKSTNNTSNNLDLAFNGNLFTKADVWSGNKLVLSGPNPTQKDGVGSSTVIRNASSTYTYTYNGSTYTSTDYVKFTNAAGNVVYYLDSYDVVPSSWVSADANGVLWARYDGIMSVQVYCPSIVNVVYNGVTFTNFASSRFLPKGVYKNGNNHLYKYNGNWYTSTDGIKFNKINMDANLNPTGVDTSTAGTIWLAGQQVITTPTYVTTNGKQYLQAGILYVNPTNLSDYYLVYKGATYTFWRDGNYIADSWNFNTSGTIVHVNSPISLYLSYIDTANTYFIAQKINTGGSNEKIISDPINGVEVQKTWNANYIYALNPYTTSNGGNMISSSSPTVDMKFSDGIFDVQITSQTQVIVYLSGSTTPLQTYTYKSYTVKQTASGFYQYVFAIPAQSTDFQSSYSTKNGYVAFLSKSFVTPDSLYYISEFNNWYGSAGEFGSANVSCKGINFCGYIDATALETFSFTNVTGSITGNISRRVIFIPINGYLVSTTDPNIFVISPADRKAITSTANISRSVAGATYTPIDLSTQLDAYVASKNAGWKS